jgi:hypothetical protein
LAWSSARRSTLWSRAQRPAAAKMPTWRIAPPGGRPRPASAAARTEVPVDNHLVVDDRQLVDLGAHVDLRQVLR